MVTRDAKIGLLVGLAFILIVGILLSEHITVTNTPQQADLAIAGANVRAATVTPTAPPAKVQTLTVDPDPQPKQALVTRDQLDSPRLPPTAKIELGQPVNGEIKVIRIDTPDPIANAVSVQPHTDTSTPPTKLEVAAAQSSSTGVPAALAEIARQNGMELMALGGESKIETRAPDAAAHLAKVETESIKPIPNGTKVKEYIAQPGDSLSRIASRQLGANTPANQAAIIALNPSLQKNSNRILAGAKYLIPADAWAAAMGEGSPAAEPQPLAETKTSTAETPAAESKTVVYVVKSGDSLWKIAEREVGSVNAIAAIKQLNAQVLGDSDVVKIGMKLKLPAKM